MEENTIILYPKADQVFSNPELAIYFKPLLTSHTSVSGKKYQIHLLGTDGLFCETKFKYSENNFFGFKYNNGTYDFLGDIRVFNEYDKVPELYTFLKKDFLKNSDLYLNNKISVSKYLSDIEFELQEISNFEDFSNAIYYAEAFYSYEFTKSYYEKYAKHSHVSAITEGFAKNTDLLLIDKEDALSILEEFFVNLKYNLENKYDINKEMFISGVAGERFMSINGGCNILAMLDTSQDIVYILEYH